MASLDLTFEKGLPSSVDTERFVLGMILLNDTYYLQVAGALEPDDFSLEKHRRIFGRMKDLYDRAERIDRVTLADELIRQGQLESVDGLAYLVSLDDGLPELAEQIYNELRIDYNVYIEDKDSIGKRYRRMDAIGTPFCITVDHDSLANQDVTVRYRDTMEQKRVKISDLGTVLQAEVSMSALLKQLL